jgi:hypothetical protein
MDKRLLGYCFALLLLVGCANQNTRDIVIDTDSDPKANLAGYKTYSWFGSAAVVNDPEGRWNPPEFDAGAEIGFLIDRELRARGMIESQSDPDLLVMYGVGIDMENVEFKIDPDSELEELANVPRGALVVIMIDPQTSLAVWGGVATAEMKQSPDSDIVRQRLDYAISSMFKQLPK